MITTVNCSVERGGEFSVFWVHRVFLREFEVPRDASHKLPVMVRGYHTILVLALVRGYVLGVFGMYSVVSSCFEVLEVVVLVDCFSFEL